MKWPELGGSVAASNSSANRCRSSLSFAAIVWCRGVGSFTRLQTDVAEQKEASDTWMLRWDGTSVQVLLSSGSSSSDRKFLHEIRAEGVGAVRPSLCLPASGLELIPAEAGERWGTPAQVTSLSQLRPEKSVNLWGKRNLKFTRNKVQIDVIFDHGSCDDASGHRALNSSNWWIKVQFWMRSDRWGHGCKPAMPVVTLQMCPTCLLSAVWLSNQPYV